VDAEVNRCVVCQRRLWHEHLGLMGNVLWTVDGEVACCCASYDADGNAVDGKCIDCCVPPAKRFTAFKPYWWQA
jgi:hypothetical protein